MSKGNNNKNKIILGIITFIIISILMCLGFDEKEINKITDVLDNGNEIEVNVQANQNENEFVNKNNNDDNNKDNIKEQINCNLQVDFIDVGQADCILITTNEKSMLIDAGNNKDGKNVVNYLKNKGITSLDYIVGTHPHADHIGGMDDVINSDIKIDNILMPKIQTNTKTFEDVLDAVKNKRLKIKAPIKGEKFNLGDAKLEVMTDSILDKDNLNLSSIILKMDFYNNSFLFTGDAEKENEISRNWPQVDVLKIGHHGSSTSSTENFVKQVKPKYGVIMVGNGNKYRIT